jgi:hypothetical protein
VKKVSFPIFDKTDRRRTESQDLLMDKNEHYSGVVFYPGNHSFPSPAELVKINRCGGIVLVAENFC